MSIARTLAARASTRCTVWHGLGNAPEKLARGGSGEQQPWHAIIHRGLVTSSGGLDLFVEGTAMGDSSQRRLALETEAATRAKLELR